MSWSANFVVRAGEPEPREDDLVLSNVNEVPEHLEQFREALASAFGILLSGVMGGKDKNYQVNISGHGNPNHEPTPGWANDAITISIYQLGEVK